MVKEIIDSVPVEDTEIDLLPSSSTEAVIKEIFDAFPRTVIAADGKNASFVGIDENTNVIYRIEIENAIKAGSNHIRSVFEITPEQYEKIKLEPPRVLQPSQTNMETSDQNARTIASFLRYDNAGFGKVKSEIENNPKNPSSDQSDQSDPSDKSASNIHFSIAPVWTGSAADYDKPSLLYVGTGEGAQVYGWGLYGSSSRGVGEGYAESDVANKRNPDVLWDGKPSDVFFREMRNDKGGTTDDYWHLSALHDMLKDKKGDIDSVKQIIQEDIELKEKFNQPKEDIEGLRRRLQLLEEFKDRINYWPGLPQETFTINGVKYIPGEGSMPKDEWLQSVITYLHNYGGDRKAAIRAAEYNIKHYRESSEKDALRDLLGRTEKVLSFLSDQSNAISYEGGTTGRRNLYKQTFWPDKQENLLDWDEKVPESQMAQIREGLRKSDQSDLSDWSDSPVFTDASGEQLYQQLVTLLGSPKAASEFLYRAGIDGITYIGNDSGVRNYVAFSDQDIRVDEHIRFSAGEDPGFEAKVKAISKVLFRYTGTGSMIESEEAYDILSKKGWKIDLENDEELLRRGAVEAMKMKRERSQENRKKREKQAVAKADAWTGLLMEKYGDDFKINAGPKYDEMIKKEPFTGTWIDRRKTERGRTGSISAEEAAKYLTEKTGKEVTADMVVSHFGDLALTDAWSKYEQHPDRAMTHTVSEQLAYRSKDTHNLKLKRIRKVFSVLKEYHGGENPFYAKSLLRSEREEQDTIVRRQAFTKDEEQRLLEELRSPKHKFERGNIFVFSSRNGT